MEYLFIELNSCCVGENIQIRFTGTTKAYLSVFTEQEYDDFVNGKLKARLNPYSSPAILKILTEGKKVAVLHLNGQDISSINADVMRFSPFFTTPEIINMKVGLGKAIVINAEDTTTQGSMIEYWEENKSQYCKIDLDNFVCPSCGKRINRDKIHGAHVRKYRNSNLYLTPTCESCNTSKVDRYFKVSIFDLVPAPPKQ